MCVMNFWKCRKINNERYFVWMCVRWKIGIFLTSSSTLALPPTLLSMHTSGRFFPGLQKQLQLASNSKSRNSADAFLLNYCLCLSLVNFIGDREIWTQILCSVDRASVYNLVNKANLVHNLFLVYLSIPRCFGWLSAHHQEKQLCFCDTWYLLFYVDDCLVCRVLHTRQSSTQNNKYQVSQNHSYISWVTRNM
jgi:hypothetical protein